MWLVGKSVMLSSACFYLVEPMSDALPVAYSFN